MEQQMTKKKKKKHKGKFRELIESILIALIIALIVRAYLVQAFKIPTGSMQPTLHGAMEYGTGDKILVNKFIFRWVRDPQRGDIIVFTTKGIRGLEEPHKNTQFAQIVNKITSTLFKEEWMAHKDFIKRLVGLPGDKVEISNEKIIVNGKVLETPKIFSQIHYYNTGSFGREGNVVTVPENSYFVLGDNSGNSKDSRYWGFVPKENLKGKAFCIYWPPSRIGGIE